MDAEGAKEFIIRHRSDIINRFSKTSANRAADSLLGKKLIPQESYDIIWKESTPAEKVRELYEAMRPSEPQSYLGFYEYLTENESLLIEDLEEKARNETDSGPPEENARNETDSGPPGKKPRTEGPVQMQVQEARHETDSGSSLNFAGYTLAKLLEHVEDQKKMESLAKSLELRLKDGEMKKIESLLKTRRLRNDVHFKHDDFNTICVNMELRAFLQTKSPAKFPMKAIDPFFMGKNEPRKKSTESSTTQEESLHKSLIGFGDSGYDSLTQQSSLSFPDPPQEAQRELETGIGTLIPPSERKQSDPDEAANGATDMAVKSAAATSAATPRATTSAPTTAATTAAAASAATASADTTAATPAATASAAKPADIVSATTTAATSSAATSATSAATAEATNSAASRAATASAAAASADTTAAIASADTSATSAAKPEETVATNGGRPNYGNPKKQQSGQVCKKSILTNKQREILRNFLIKQIPSEKLKTEEELKEIIACITIVDFHDHPRYPLLRAYDCIVFRDPKTNQRKLVEILKNGNLKKDLNFKVQFHMWLLELSEAVLLSEKEETEVTQSFQPEEKTFRQYLHDLVVPVLAVYKKARLENELSNQPDAKEEDCNQTTNISPVLSN